MTTQLNVQGFQFTLRTAYDTEESVSIVEAKCEKFHNNKCYEIYSGPRYFDFNDESDIDTLIISLNQLIEMKGI